jgi:hypothetical protein
MRRLPAILSLLLTIVLPLPVAAQGFELSEPAAELSWPAGDWNGKHALEKVYCLTFPAPRNATRLTSALLNKRSISLTRVLYATDKLALFIVTSAIPAGRSPAEEVTRLRRANAAYTAMAPAQLQASELNSAFGPTGGLTIRNATEGGPGEPFPLVRKIATYDDGLLHSLSVHRLVARGPDRFEIAALRYFHGPVSAAGEKVELKALTAMVDQTVEALHRCTVKLPLRQPG